MTGISLRYGISKSSPSCKSGHFFIGKESSGLTCPGIYIVKSYGVQLTKANIFGRIDVFKSVFVRLDSLTATMPAFAYDRSVPYRGFDTYGVIRMGETSLGATIIASNNVISNCEVYGHWELITIYRGAVGVTIRNNYLHGFQFVAIRCGARVSEVMDCHHNVIANNLIWNPPNYPDSSITDDNNAGNQQPTCYSTVLAVPFGMSSCCYVSEYCHSWTQQLCEECCRWSQQRRSPVLSVNAQQLCPCNTICCNTVLKVSSPLQLPSIDSHPGNVLRGASSQP